MKAILEFDLPDDKEEFKRANNGTLYYCSLWDIKEKIRNIIRYGARSEDYKSELESLRDLFPEDME